MIYIYIYFHISQIFILFFSILFQLLTDSLHLREGGGTANVSFISNSPPSLLCVRGNKQPDCVVTVMAYIRDVNPLICASANQMILPQVLFPDGAQSELCSVKVTNENWRTVRSISVIANQDGWLDGTTNSTITLTVNLGSQDFYTALDKTLQVH